MTISYNKKKKTYKKLLIDFLVESRTLEASFFSTKININNLIYLSLFFFFFFFFFFIHFSIDNQISTVIDCITIV